MPITPPPKKRRLELPVGDSKRQKIGEGRPKRRGSSVYIGVSKVPSKTGVRWRGQFSHGSKVHGCGTYDLEIQAARAVNNKCDELGIPRKNPDLRDVVPKVKCKRGHVMQKFKKGKMPADLRQKGYEYVACDVCNKQKIDKMIISSQGIDGYFHCGVCEFDICSICSDRKVASMSIFEDDSDSETDEAARPSMDFMNLKIGPPIKTEPEDPPAIDTSDAKFKSGDIVRLTKKKREWFTAGGFENLSKIFEIKKAPICKIDAETSEVQFLYNVEGLYGERFPGMNESDLVHYSDHEAEVRKLRNLHKTQLRQKKREIKYDCSQNEVDREKKIERCGSKAKAEENKNKIEKFCNGQMQSKADTMSRKAELQQELEQLDAREKKLYSEIRKLEDELGKARTQLGKARTQRKNKRDILLVVDKAYSTIEKQIVDSLQKLESSKKEVKKETEEFNKLKAKISERDTRIVQNTRERNRYRHIIDTASQLLKTGEEIKAEDLLKMKQLIDFTGP